jgi:hypothetical protein
LGFINKKVRAASVLVVKDTVFGFLDQKGYESSVVESDKRRIRVYGQSLSPEKHEIHLNYIIPFQYTSIS